MIPDVAHSGVTGYAAVCIIGSELKCICKHFLCDFPEIDRFALRQKVSVIAQENNGILIPLGILSDREYREEILN